MLLVVGFVYEGIVFVISVGDKDTLDDVFEPTRAVLLEAY